MENKGELGRRILRLREQAKLTQTDVAELLGVTDGAVSNWEHGIRMPGVKNLLTLAELLGVSTDYLLCGYEDSI